MLHQIVWQIVEVRCHAGQAFCFADPALDLRWRHGHQSYYRFVGPGDHDLFPASARAISAESWALAWWMFTVDCIGLIGSRLLDSWTNYVVPVYRTLARCPNGGRVSFSTWS